MKIKQWKEVRLGDHVRYLRTVALSRAQLDAGSPLRYLHYGDIHTHRGVRLDAANDSMPRAGAELVRGAGRLRVGDLVFADASEDLDGVGKSVEIVSIPTDGVVAGLHTIAARFDKLVLADGFKAYLQFHPSFRQQLLRLAAGTKVLATTRSFISSVILSLPELDEQRRIAMMLRDFEDLSATLQRRIAKKQAIKQGMTQELLTGRTRLPGFTGIWTSTTLGALGTFLKGWGIKRNDVKSFGTPCIRYGELYTAFQNYTTETRSFVTAEVASTALPLRSGDVLFAGSGETREEIGKCIAYVGPTPAVAGGDVIVLRTELSNAVYLALLANTPEVMVQMARAGQGDAVVHIYSNSLAAVKVTLPPRDEQDAIAGALVDADHEIRRMHHQLAKACNIRQGMMQELLTGRVRLPRKAVS